MSYTKKFKVISIFTLLTFYLQVLNPALLGYSHTSWQKLANEMISAAQAVELPTSTPTPIAATLAVQPTLDLNSLLAANSPNAEEPNFDPLVDQLFPTETAQLRFTAPATQHLEYVPSYAQQRDVDPLLASTAEFDLADPYLVAKANELGKDPQRIFAFVRDSIEFESYVGSLRGARGALWSSAGNALDKASLLVALLRISGIKARYVKGALAQARAKELLGSMFKPPLRVLGCMADDAILSDPINDTNLIAEAQQHVWVEFQQGTAFTAADPTFNSAQLGQTFATATSQFTVVPDVLRHKVAARLLAEYGDNIFGLSLDKSIVLTHTFTTAELVGKPLSVAHFVNSTQQNILFISNNIHTYSPFLLVGQNDNNIEDDPIIHGQDYQESISSLLGPLFNSRVTGVFLQIDVIQPNGQKEQFERALLDRIGFVGRTNIETATITNNIANNEPVLTPFDIMTVNVLPNSQPIATLATERERITSIRTKLDILQPQLEALPTNPTSITDAQSAVLAQALTLNSYATLVIGEIAGTSYALAADKLLMQLEQGYLTRAYYQSPRLLITQTHKNQDELVIHFDIRKNDLRVLPAPGQTLNSRLIFEMTRGMVESQLESEVLSQILGTSKSLNAMDIFQQSPRDAIILLSEQSISLLESTQLSAEARLRITQAVFNNKIVMTPNIMLSIDGENTVAWLEVDRQTGHTIAVSENGNHQALGSFLFSISSFNLDLNQYGFALGFTESFDRTLLIYIDVFLQSTLDNINNEHLTEIAIKQAKVAVVSSVIRQLVDFIQDKIPGGIGLGVCIGRAFDAQNPLMDGIACAKDYVIEELLPSVPGSDGYELGVIVGMINGLGFLYAVMPHDPPVLPFLVDDLAPNPALVTPGSVAAFNVKVISDDLFTMPISGGTLPSVFVAQIQNTGPTATTFNIDFNNAPIGYKLYSSVSQLTVPAGKTGEVGVCLQPTTINLGTPGTAVPFQVTVTDTATNQTHTTPNTTFTTPQVVGVTLDAAPSQNTIAPGGTIHANLSIKSVGNVAAPNIPLTLEKSTGLTVTGLPATVSLALNETKTVPLTLTVSNSAALNDSLTATITAKFGHNLDGNPYQASAAVVVNLRSAQIQPIEHCAQTASSANNTQLAQNIASIAAVTAQLQQHPTDAAFCGRLTLLYEQLLALADVNTGLTSLKPQIQALRDLAANCNTAQLLTTAAQFFTTNCAIQALSSAVAISLLPTSASLELGQGTTFKLQLKNTDTQAATFNLSVDTFPANVTGTLNRTSVTLSAGETLDANSASPVTLTLNQTLTTSQTFAVRVLAKLAATDVTFTASGLVRVAPSQADVISVAANPAVIDQTHTSTVVTAQIYNAANISRAVLAQLQVLDQAGTVLQTLPSVAVTLVPSSTTQAVNLGTISITGLSNGVYRLRARLLTTANQVIPGQMAETLLFVGMPIKATIRSEPAVVAPGNPTVKTIIEVTK